MAPWSCGGRGRGGGLSPLGTGRRLLFLAGDGFVARWCSRVHRTLRRGCRLHFHHLLFARSVPATALTVRRTAQRRQTLNLNGDDDDDEGEGAEAHLPLSQGFECLRRRIPQARLGVLVLGRQSRDDANWSRRICERMKERKREHGEQKSVRSRKEESSEQVHAMGLCCSTSGSWFTCVKLSRFPFGVDTNEMAGPSTLHEEEEEEEAVLPARSRSVQGLCDVVAWRTLFACG